MAPSSSRPSVSSEGTPHRMSNRLQIFSHAARPIRTLTRAAIFFLNVFPMLPSRSINWMTRSPIREKVMYSTRSSQTEGELYRPSGSGPHPGIVVCLGVVPFGVDHPQVPILGKALARSGFVALLYWSPAMRDFRLDPGDIESIALAYHWLVERPDVDPERSGLLGTCVGGAFALMAAASPHIRDRVSFISAYAPYASMWTFAQDIASATHPCGDGREPWQVDPLTRKVFVHSLTAWLEPGEAKRLRETLTEPSGHLDSRDLTADGQALYPLLIALDADEAGAALHRLPPVMQECLAALSPMNYLKDIHAPLIVLLHDHGDQVIPVSESRRLLSALGGRTGVHYTEMRFQHLDPMKGKLPWFRLVQQFGMFFLAVYPLFRQAVAGVKGACVPLKPSQESPSSLPMESIEQRRDRHTSSSPHLAP